MGEIIVASYLVESESRIRIYNFGKQKIPIVEITDEIPELEEINNENRKSSAITGTMEKIKKVANIDEKTPLHAAMFNCTDASHSYMIGYFVTKNKLKAFLTFLLLLANILDKNFRFNIL